MIKKSIIVMVAIIATVGIVFAAYSGAGYGGSTNSNDLEKQSNSNTNASTATSVATSTKISATKAQEIAQKYIDEPGAKAGTPKLTKIDGKEVYVVPVIDNGQQVGEIEIDAQTGENLGGAGGAP